MRRFVEQMSPASHQNVLDAVRDAGRAGAARVPDTALFPAPADPTQDITDTGIFRLVDALEVGRAERQKDAA